MCRDPLILCEKIILQNVTILEYFDYINNTH